jgi:hypothetical protein
VDCSQSLRSIANMIPMQLLPGQSSSPVMVEVICYKRRCQGTLQISMYVAQTCILAGPHPGPILHGSCLTVWPSA